MRRAVAAACAAAGLISLWTLMPRHDVALGEGQPELGREEAIQRAVEWARQHGVEIAGWRFATGAEIDPALARIRRQHPGSSVARAFTPVRIRVLAFHSTGDAVEVTMTATGRPLSFQDRRLAVSGGRAADAAGEELARLAGAEAVQFQRTAENVRTLEGSRSAWEWPDPVLQGVVARVVVVTRNGRVVNSSYEFAATRDATGPPPGAGSLRAAWAIAPLASVAVIGGLLVWTLFVTLQKRTDPFGFAARFLWIPAAATAAAFLSGNYQNDALLRSFEEGVIGDSRLVLGVTVAALQLLGLYLILAAAYAAAPPSQMKRWAAAALLVRGIWKNREAAAQAWTGLAAGALIGAVPYWVASVFGTPRVRFLEGTNLLTAPVPALEALEGLATGWEVYLAVLFLYPWLSGRWKRGWAAWLGMLAAGTAITAAYRGAFPPGHPANLATGALMTAGHWLTYRYGGMLAAWLAPLGMYGAVQGVRLAQLPAPSLSMAGWQMLALVGGAAIAALGASFLLPEADTQAVEAEMAEAATALPRSQRERLRAELEVARRAQEDLLPAAPPQIEGFEVAAACHPAREVGGDLYDCLPCPHGRWLLCVADVSGKGLGAALHMTLVKGMLASAAHHAPPPRTLAARLNQAVGDAGRGRMFTTMSMLMLDPRARRAEHVRAGHNPPLVWRAATGECEWRKPRGIGLGLAGAATFEANLETETIELQAGDTLVLYSDGVTEDMNEAGEQFGEERLKALVQAHAAEGPHRLASAIMEEARRFRGQEDLHDDWTLLALRCNDGAAGAQDGQGKV